MGSVSELRTGQGRVLISKPYTVQKHVNKTGSRQQSSGTVSTLQGVKAGL